MAITIETDISGMQISGETNEELVSVMARVLDESPACRFTGYKRHNKTWFVNVSEVHKKLIEDYCLGKYDHIEEY